MKRSRELEDLTRGLYSAVSAGDVSFFERHLWQGEACVVIGTAPGEWWDSYEDALGAIRTQMAHAGNAIQLVPGEVCAFQEGSVGWIADRPTLTLGSVAAPCRHTSVCVKQDGRWHIVQHHFSIGVSNEVVFGPEAAKLG
jgi:hypothetical protein